MQIGQCLTDIIKANVLWTNLFSMPRIVNRMVVARASHPLNLESLSKKIPSCHYRRARPCRIYFKWNKIPIQLFPRGCIQILGNTTQEQCLQVWHYLSGLLHPIIVSRPQVKSCTVVCSWQNEILQNKLKTLPSSANVSNERELFPGTLISIPRKLSCKQCNFHCALFPNGQAIITGVVSSSEAERVLKQAINKLL